MASPRVFLVDGSGQPFSLRVEAAVLTWVSRLRLAFPTLDDVAIVEVLEEAARRVVRREASGGALEHIHAYAWAAIRSVAVSRLRLGRERVTQMTVQRPVQVDSLQPAHHRLPVRGAEAAVLLGEVLEHLSPVERQVLRMKAAGFSSAEIAEQVGRAPTTIDSMHSRAMAKLRSLAAGTFMSRSGLPKG